MRMIVIGCGDGATAGRSACWVERGSVVRSADGAGAVEAAHGLAWGRSAGSRLPPLLRRGARLKGSLSGGPVASGDGSLAAAIRLRSVRPPCLWERACPRWAPRARQALHRGQARSHSSVEHGHREYRSSAPANRALADRWAGSIWFAHPLPWLVRRLSRPRPSGFAGSWAAPPSRPAQAAFPESRCAPRCRPGCAAAGRARRSRARFRSGRCRP